MRLFRVNPGTGVIYTADRLDYEARTQHILTVMVSQGKNCVHLVDLCLCVCITVCVCVPVLFQIMLLLAVLPALLNFSGFLSFLASYNTIHIFLILPDAAPGQGSGVSI